MHWCEYPGCGVECDPYTPNEKRGFEQFVNGMVPITCSREHFEAMVESRAADDARSYVPERCVFGDGFGPSVFHR